MKRAIFAALLAMLVMLTACSGMNDKESIRAFVEENEEALMLSIRNGNYDRVLILDGVYHAYLDFDSVVFSCGKSGLLRDTRCGFYYSMDGEAAGAGYANKWKFKQQGDGYVWEQPKGDNIYYTEHLYGNFYYYEMTW